MPNCLDANGRREGREAMAGRWIEIRADGVVWVRVGLRGPSSTWTYLIKACLDTRCSGWSNAATAASYRVAAVCPRAGVSAALMP